MKAALGERDAALRARDNEIAELKVQHVVLQNALAAAQQQNALAAAQQQQLFAQPAVPALVAAGGAVAQPVFVVAPVVGVEAAAPVLPSAF